MISGFKTRWGSQLLVALCALAVLSAPPASAGLVKFCEDLLFSSDRITPDTGSTATGSMDVFFDEEVPEARFVGSFEGIVSEGKFRVFSLNESGELDQEILDLDSSITGTDFNATLSIAQFGAIQLALSQNGARVVIFDGDDPAIAADLDECVAPVFTPQCSFPMSGDRAVPPTTTEATGTVAVFVSETGDFRLTIAADGVPSFTELAIYSLDEFGELDAQLLLIDSGTGTTPISIDIDAADVPTLQAAIGDNGAKVVMTAGEDTIAGNFTECTPPAEGEGEGVVEGEGEGVVEGEGEGVEEGQAPTGTLRLVHGAASVLEVDICLDGNLGGSVSFGTIGAYTEIPTGVHTITVFAVGDGCGGTVLAQFEFALDEGQIKTILVADNPAKNGDPLQIVSVDDVNEDPSEPGKARIRAINLSTDTTIDFNQQGDPTPVFDDLPFLGVSGYGEVPAPQSFIAEVRSSNGEDLLVTADARDLGDGGTYTFFVLGLSGGEPPLQLGSSADVDVPIGEGEGEGVVEGEGEGVVEGEGEGEGVVEGEGEGVVEGEGEGVVEGEGEGVVEGEGEGVAEGEGEDTGVDFCDIMDELAGLVSDDILGPVLADLLGDDISLLQLLSCDVADINGEIPVFEGEQEAEGPSVVDQLPGPNGILDGRFELAVLAELINNGGAYTDLLANGGVDSTIVAAAFEANYAVALGAVSEATLQELAGLFALFLGPELEGEVEGQELRDEIILRAAGLIPNIGRLLAGYATLGDDNSLTIVTVVLKLVADALDPNENILGLGLDPNGYTRLNAILSINGDADGDGCTQGQEYNVLFGSGKGGLGPQDYIDAVLDPALPVDGCEVQEGEGEVEGEPIRHKGDLDGDGKIGLSDLLRLIQLFNAGSYSCTTNKGDNDGYQPGSGGTAPGVGDCEVHSIDFDGTTGVISLSEVLRGIQFYNLQLELVFTGAGEDGWSFVQAG